MKLSKLLLFFLFTASVYFVSSISYLVSRKEEKESLKGKAKNAKP